MSMLFNIFHANNLFLHLKAMKISYEDAMQNLKTMFSGIDQEVIKTVLVSNKGKIDPTIEDLLKLCDDKAYEDENIFDEVPNQNSSSINNEVLDDLEIAIQEQEKEDMEFALQIQQKYINAGTSERTQKQRYPEGNLEDYIAVQPRYHRQRAFVGQEPIQPQVRYIQPVIEQQPYRFQQQQVQPLYYGKPKTTFSQKIKDAKAKFVNMFKKGKKKVSTTVTENNQGGYAEIDNYDDLRLINIKDSEKDGNRDLDGIPDLKVKPYTDLNINSQTMREISYKLPEDIDVRSQKEEDSANFKLYQQEHSNNTILENAFQNKSGAVYPRFDQKYHAEYKESYENTKSQ